MTFLSEDSGKVTRVGTGAGAEAGYPSAALFSYSSFSFVTASEPEYAGLNI